ncbi:MAG: VanZ family protein [Atopobiaceae bacterium]
MRAIVALGYEAVCALVPYAIASGVNAHRSRAAASASPRPSMWVHRLAVALFGICLFSILWICGVGTFADLWRGTSLKIMLNINLVPFDAYLNWTTWALNVVLFVPLGFLLPCCWEGYDRIGHTALFGFLFSLAIELSQLLNFRVTDIDDLIANTLGAVVGCIVFLVLRALIPRWWERHLGSQTLEPRGNAAKDAAVLFLGVFFLYASRRHAEMGIVNFLDRL